MKEAPAYLKVRYERRREALTKFLREMVIPDDFSSEDVGILENQCSEGDAKNAFCEWFDLGSWFYDEMETLEFNVDDFLCNLRIDIEQEEREATEDYYERQRDYEQMVRGGAI